MRFIFYIAWMLITAINLIAQNNFYELKSLDFNLKSNNEANAVPFNGGMVFVADYKTEIIRSYVTPEQTPTYDIYVVYPKSDKKWSDPVLFSKSLSSKNHEGPFCFNRNKTQFLYTRNIDNNFRSSNTLGIFIAALQDTLVANEVPFPYNSAEYNVIHPSLSDDGKTLYFSSDMPDGEGGYDIYVSELKNGEWTKPLNLGQTVNTRRDEKSPFIHSSGRLYFSSRGHEGFGRYDIFYTQKADQKWITPINAGEPINSRRSDAGIFFTNQDLSKGFLTSDRDRSLDIFEITSTFPEFSNCTEIQENEYCYVFFETGSMNLDSTSLSYEWDLGDGTKVRGLEAKHCFKGPGNYNIALNVIDTLTGEVYFSEASYEFTLEDHIQTYISSPDTAIVGKEITLSAQKSNLNFELDDYYWDLGDFTKKSGSQISHIFSQPGEYIVKLGATGDVRRNQEPPTLCNYKIITVLPKD